MVKLRIFRWEDDAGLSGGPEVTHISLRRWRQRSVVSYEKRSRWSIRRGGVMEAT